LRKKQPQKKLINQKPKKVLIEGGRKKMQPIPWTEQPTGALVGAGSLDLMKKCRLSHGQNGQLREWFGLEFKRYKLQFFINPNRVGSKTLDVKKE